MSMPPLQQYGAHTLHCSMTTQLLSPCCSDSNHHEVLERIILKHIKDVIPAGVDSHQFPYSENLSTEDKSQLYTLPCPA